MVHMSGVVTQVLGSRLIPGRSVNIFQKHYCAGDEQTTMASYPEIVSDRWLPHNLAALSDALQAGNKKDEVHQPLPLRGKCPTNKPRRMWSIGPLQRLSTMPSNLHLPEKAPSLRPNLTIHLFQWALQRTVRKRVCVLPAGVLYMHRWLIICERRRAM